ncbi:PepSY-associated TM helix domain-containing protein [Ornithobacterium rhinotracheale]
MKTKSCRYKKFIKLNRDYHRDLGYFFSGLVIIYCLSGIAFNHIDDWNPDFILNKKEIQIKQELDKAHFSDKMAHELSQLCGEKEYKLYDFPTPYQVKIYYKDASFHVDFNKKMGVYEQITRRPVFYEANVLHRNNVKAWRWFADIFSVALIIIVVTGLFIASGKNSFKKRGFIFFALGFIPPIVAIIIHYLN